MKVTCHTAMAWSGFISGLLLLLTATTTTSAGKPRGKGPPTTPPSASPPALGPGSSPAALTPPEDTSVTPEITTGYRSGMKAVSHPHFAVATANPLASAAAHRILAEGGTAADALVAAQFVLGLTEPQSSGLGGGGYVLYFDAAQNQLFAIDGRETAPCAAEENYLIQISAQDPTPPLPDARRSGRSIGVPGIVAALGQLHATHGHTAWARLLTPARELAENGFRISPRMSASVASFAADLSRDPAAAAYFLQPDGHAKPAGTLLCNPAYAETLRLIAAGGPAAFYRGEIAADIVERVNRKTPGVTPGRMSHTDLENYTPLYREVLSATYRDLLVYGISPSSAGGVAVLNTLGILENFDLARYPPTQVGDNGGLPHPMAIHLISEAQRLAYADRDAYLGDPAFVDIPGGVNELFSREYTRYRAGLINQERSMGRAVPGLDIVANSAPVTESGTSHISVIDTYGNAAALTTSVEAAFGSFHFTRGFLLNNQLMDFSTIPRDNAGTPVANRVEPGKRPRSSMSPTLVFHTTAEGERGDLFMSLGSPGGSLIIQFVIKTLINIIDWGMDPQQAVSAPSFGALNQPQTRLGIEHPLLLEHGTELATALEVLGHQVFSSVQSSGLSVLVRGSDGMITGGADPRREGVVRGG
ncbi:Gamma-glutamyltranspeptidase precursor [Corynebacterium occultum]|uniref:Gamma-glutamyltranspeptidase n=1 Tax=Corynebacterium occultum TaxID=2675219 RepID=A0A6B8W9Q7_9CORY|nr:gamma-glutamyltransferase family protein [Corynebacterium occultum]QGU08005.1 Gamma-glutamyltranspeptidase precursor [Corynebacterium occultum]